MSLTTSILRTRRSQRGLSLVELMVGITVGLFVAAAAAMLTATQLGENRRLMLEAQVQQDLRATADIISRELRRAGYWGLAQDGVWDPTNPNTVRSSEGTLAPLASAATQVDYRYTRSTGVPADTGFKLEGTRVKTLLTIPNSWQDLTDGNALKITGFTVTPRHAEEPLPGGGQPERLPCPKLCADGTRNCWPTVRVREFQVDIAGESTSDPNVKRSVRTIVRLRNDQIVVPPAVPASGPVCPA